jgi:hypothetical protein
MVGPPSPTLTSRQLMLLHEFPFVSRFAYESMRWRVGGNLDLAFTPFGCE